MSAAAATLPLLSFFLFKESSIFCFKKEKGEKRVLFQFHDRLIPLHLLNYTFFAAVEKASKNEFYLVVVSQILSGHAHQISVYFWFLAKTAA